MAQQFILKQHYSGTLTKEIVLEPGMYLVGDPRLCGLEEYLVTVQGIAEFVGEPDAPPQKPVEPPKPSPQEPKEGDPVRLDYSKMDIEMLRAIATERGVLDQIPPTGKSGNLLVGDLRAYLAAMDPPVDDGADDDDGDEDEDHDGE